MKKSIFSVACALVLGALLGPSVTPAKAAPKKPPTNLELLNLALSKVKPGQKLIYFGDMGVPVQRVRALRDMEMGRSSNLAFGANVRYWPGGKVPYDFDAALPKSEQDSFIAAAREWEKWANLSFFPRTNETNYIHVFKDPTANGYSYSALGMVGGAQNMSLDAGSGTWVTAHEMGHALGCEHEHQRSDRDQFLTIQFDNVKPEFMGAFTIINNSNNVTEYDFDSIMHYFDTAFSVDGVKKTMVVKPGYENFQGKFGQQTHLSELDKAGMAKIYGFPPGVTATPLPTPTLPPRPTISVNPVAVAEGNPGDKEAATLTFKIRLTQVPNKDVSFAYKIVRDPIKHNDNSSDPSASALEPDELNQYSAQPDIDYIDNKTQGTIILPAATTDNNGNSTREASISVTIKGDTTVENDESLLLILSDPVNARFMDEEKTMTVKGTILNDDFAATATPLPPPTATPKPSATPVVTATPKPTTTPGPTPISTPTSAPPTASVSLFPPSFPKDTAVVATVNLTPSNGTTYTITWKLNGRTIVTGASRVDFARVSSEKKGDTITVEVIPKRNGVTGKTATTTAVVGNTAPVANSTSTTTRSAVPVSVLLSGSDGDGDALSYIITSTPESGTASITKSDGRSTLTYTSDVGFIGTESIGIAAKDGTDQSLDAAVRINVQANTSPKLGSVTPTGQSYSTGTPITFKQTVSDSEDNLETVELLLSNSASSPVTTNGLYAIYDVATKTFRLQNSSGSAFSNPKGIGVGTQNTQANVVLKAVSQSGNTLTLTYEITPQTTWTGVKTFWSSAEDRGGLRADFTQMGKVTFFRQTPGTSANPSSGKS